MMNMTVLMCRIGAVFVLMALTGLPSLARAEEIRLPVTRDTWVSTVGSEATANLGGASRLKLKSIQEMTLIDIDPTPLRGRVIERADLHVKLAGSERLWRVTVGTVTAEWEEGRSETYEAGARGASFAFRRNPTTPWRERTGGDLTSVIFGQTGSIWRMADASEPDKDGWQTIPVDPSIITARAEGRAQGFLVFDDTGTEWTRDGETYQSRLFPNRFIHSRESGAGNAPYLTITLGPKAKNTTVVAAKPAEIVEDRAVVPATLPVVTLTPMAGGRVALGGGTVEVVDELDVWPSEGTDRKPGQANPLWDAERRLIRMQSARNEFIAFQVAVEGRDRSLDAVRTEVRFDEPASAAIRAEVGRYIEVGTKDQRWVPDPIVPINDRHAGWPSVPGRERRSLHVELYVPREMKAGLHRGTLRLDAGQDRLDLSIELTVWNATLPDRLSFLPEMNCYDLPANERDYYRMAQKHRVVLNRVPYYQNGRLAEGAVPGWDGRRLDWTDYDQRFGPLLDGSAFADLPRGKVPIECFYLPIHENWPTPIEPHFNGNYWADLAFSDEYREALVEVSRQFAEHATGQGWNETLFHGFLNGKSDFKQRGWSRGSSPWLLDEPANFADFWALRWFGLAMHEGWHAAKLKPEAGPRFVFRADISRPQWQRDSLDGLLDYSVVNNGSFREYGPMIRERKRAEGQIVVEYGGANPIGTSNQQAVAWSLDAWSRGADGVLPWQTIGTADSWSKADELSLFYPGREAGDPPVPSVRLKAYRRGEQDIELLTLYAQAAGLSRESLAAAVRETLDLSGERQGTQTGGAEDAGRLAYERIDATAAWTLRARIGAALSALKPPPRDRLVEFRTPPRDPARVEPRLVAGSENRGQVGFIGQSASVAKRAARPPAGSLTHIISGHTHVIDALIDPARREQRLSGVGRENALVKGDQVSAFLVAFDLDELRGVSPERIHSATLSLFVWDPSSRGRTRVDARVLTTAWDAAARWSGPKQGGRWAGGAFDPERDAAATVATTIVEPDAPGSDIADSPVELLLDVTEAVRGWLADPATNRGLALIPVADRSIDEGHLTRFQLYGSEEATGRLGPRLTLTVGRADR